jgi:hypothetical protein
MGQRRNTKKSSVATVENDVRHTKSGVTPLRPASTPSPSAKAATRPNPAPAKGPTHEQIARRAHEIWIKSGCKHGQDRQNWLDAEAQLKKEVTGK